MAPKRLVIDTDIARSASQSDDPLAKACSDALETVRHHQHQLVVSPAVWEEWKKHRSGYAANWLRTMLARKLVVWLTDVTDPQLRVRLTKAVTKPKDREAMLKDTHLLEAALSTDERILSRNDAQRDQFAEVCDQIKEIEAVMWLNPVTHSEPCLDWLKEGAPDDNAHTLKQHRSRLAGE
jgi:hypothetical protein